MLKIKQFGWLTLRFCILGPLVIIIKLGEYAEDLFEYLDARMRDMHD